MSELRQGYGLIIGINDYRNGISPLQSAVADAAAIAELLGEEHEYRITKLLDEQATRAGVRSGLENLAGQIDSESAFLLYFAGHGIARGDGNDGPQGYLLPQDAQPADVDSWLSMEWLRETLDALPCPHLLVVLDCCFAGSFRWASTRSFKFGGKPLYDSQFQRYLKGTAWQALTSASANQKALDVSPGTSNTRDGIVVSGHSPFAAALMSGLSGDADSSRRGHNPDGVITATELFQYTFEELVPPDEAAVQTPGIWPLKPDNQGEYIFRSPGQALNTVEDPPLDDANNPWVGLQAYSEAQNALFFGRERVIHELVDRMERKPGLLVVLGASGTGKSSVVKAGLVPRLQHPVAADRERIGDWCVVEMDRLRDDPDRQLAAAIEALGKIESGRHRLLLIDQFEELYTQSRNPEAREEFLIHLRQLIGAEGTTVVLTLRSDFEPRPASSKYLRDLWDADDARYIVPPFTLEEYRECVEGPAREKAVYFEPPGLVDELLDEVAAMPGALPMLSFALSEMYRSAQLRRRDSGDNDRALTLEDYKAIGGMVGAMHRRATMLYEESDEATRASIQRLFLRMLSSEHGRVARRRVRRQELVWADPLEAKRVDFVLKQYIEARLLVADGDAIEPAHDTLVAAWDLLLDWREQAGPQELLRAVWRDAVDWSGNDNDEGLLWDNNPGRMAEAEARAEELNRLETEFIATGRQSFVRKRRKRWMTTGVVIAIISLLVYFGIKQTFEAFIQGDERDDAEIARDKLFLDLHSRKPHAFGVSDVLNDAEGGSLEVIDPAPGRWTTLISDADKPFAIAARDPWLSLGEGESIVLEGEEVQAWLGRIVALGYSDLQQITDTGQRAVQFLEHSLSWLETDPWSPIYLSVGHGEKLGGLRHDITPLREIPADWNVCKTEEQQSCVCVDEKTDWFLGVEGIRIYGGPDDPFFAGSSLHTQLWDSGYCLIYAVSDLTVLNSDDVAQGVLVVANATRLPEDQNSAIRSWVIDDDNGLLVSGSGAEWLRSGSGSLSKYPMNQLMGIFGIRWTDRPIQPVQ